MLPPVPVMTELTLLNETVPLPLTVNVLAPRFSAAAAVLPTTLTVRPLATFHDWLAPSVIGSLMVRFCVAADMSMPDAPSVSALPSPTVPTTTAAVGLTMEMPSQLVLGVPRPNVPPALRLSQRAISVAPGGATAAVFWVKLNQLAARLKS